MPKVILLPSTPLRDLNFKPGPFHDIVEPPED
jgi:hypothetical protein